MQGSSNSPVQKKYEFAIQDFKSPIGPKQLNEWGERGWQIVHIFERPQHNIFQIVFQREIT